MKELTHKDGNITIFGRDSQVMCEVSDNKVDAIITSPPYNTNQKYWGKVNYNDKVSDIEYRHLLSRVFHECHRVLKEEGVFFLNVGFNRQDLKKAWDVLSIAESSGFGYFQPVIWMKSYQGEGHHRGSKNPNQFYLNYEYIFILTKTDKFKIEPKRIGIPYKVKSNLKRFKHKEDVRDAGNVWFIPYDTQSGADRIKYPSIYPFKLVQNCIDVLNVDKGIILDPFCGTGTTLIVAEDNGLNAIGYDITFNIDEFNKRKRQYEEKKTKNNKTKSV